jgi:hypothetical protein
VSYACIDTLTLVFAVLKNCTAGRSANLLHQFVRVVMSYDVPLERILHLALLLFGSADLAFKAEEIVTRGTFSADDTVVHPQGDQGLRMRDGLAHLGMLARPVVLRCDASHT